MAERLTVGRVRAMLALLDTAIEVEGTWLEGALYDLRPEDGADWAGKLRHFDERLRLASEAREILHAQYLAPAPDETPKEDDPLF